MNSFLIESQNVMRNGLNTTTVDIQDYSWTKRELQKHG